MVKIDDEFYMNMLLNHAWHYQCLALPNPTVGAMVIDINQSILSINIHSNYGDAHAELGAAKLAYIKLSNNNKLSEINNPNDIYDFLIKNHNNLFKNTIFYTTLEPCGHVGKTPSCALLLSILKPKRVIICSKEKNKVAKNGIKILKKANIEIKDKVCKKKGDDLLLPSLRLTNKSSFCVYKIAQRLNGSFQNGIISSIESRMYSHKLRNVASKIIISQKTLIHDNPLLDSRLCNGRAPDVCVVGRQNKLNNKLKAYSIKNRNITFVNKISDIDFSGFNIIEGGAKLFEAMIDYIDCMLVFIAPQIINDTNFYTNFKGKILHSRQIGEDVLLWIQKN